MHGNNTPPFVRYGRPRGIGGSLSAERCAAFLGFFGSRACGRRWGRGVRVRWRRQPERSGNIERRRSRRSGLWRSLVAHLTGGQGVAGSNPVSPTTQSQVEGQFLSNRDWPSPRFWGPHARAAGHLQPAPAPSRLPPYPSRLPPYPSPIAQKALRVDYASRSTLTAFWESWSGRRGPSRGPPRAADQARKRARDRPLRRGRDDRL